MRTLIRLLLAAAVAATAGAQTPKNVILIIGDGCGPAHFTAMRYLRGDKTHIARMKHIGLVTTHAVDAAVTDSAASASAYATGVKTNYEMVSVDPNGVPQPTVLELAEKKGRATGLVTTAPFADATPAAFAAHAKHRDELAAIIPQMLRSGAELIVGGGLELAGKNNLPTVDQLRAQTGYTVITTAAELWNAPKNARVVGLFKTEPRDTEWADAPLARLATWALERLSADPEGFFLLLESEGTDSTSHRNFWVELGPALEGLDAAIGVALDFAAARGDTLVIVTGDHETGGMRIFETRQRRRWRAEFSTVEHTATMVPIFAFGPGAEAFTGIMDNSDVGKKLLALQK
jgi:alkaline phosphatase